MTRYRQEPFNLVHNSQYSFYKLYINDVCQFDEFLDIIKQNPQELKWFRYIISLMDNISDRILYPKEKFNHIKGVGRNDVYEFKKERLRIYVIMQKPDMFIILGGFKNNQDQDIARIKTLISDF